MRANLFILLFIITQSLHAAEVSEGGWIKGPLLQVMDDGNSLKEVDEYGGTIPIGFAAFQKLAIRSGLKENSWIVSGTVCSTNAGGTKQGTAIYAGYSGGQLLLVAMSNLKGEVLFSVSPMWDKEGKTVAPTHLYIGESPHNTLLKGTIMRRYVLRPRE
jgi:hypothetical protein